MAVVVHILIALLTLPGPTGAENTTDNSSMLPKLYLYNTLSMYVTSNIRNTSTLGADGTTQSHVSATRRDVRTVDVDSSNSSVNNDNILITTETAAGNTMDTGNIASENVRGQTTINIMDTGNVASESVPEQTAGNNMNTGNVASENVRGKTIINTKDTGNVATESVPGQTAGSQTAGNTSSAVSSGLDPVSYTHLTLPTNHRV